MLKRIKLIASGVISGALLPLAFAPYDLPYMAVIALVLFLFFLRPLNRLQSIKFGYAFGWGYFGHGVYWVYYSIHHFGHAPLWLAVIIMLGMVAILALYMALLAYLLNRFFQHNAAVRYLLAFPALWVGLEALRAVLFTGFPWLSLGYSQIDTWISAWGPIMGVLGMSWLIVLTTGVIAYAFNESETFARESVFVRAPTVGALGETKEAIKRSLQGVNGHFYPVFNAAIAENGLAQRSQSTIRYKFIASLLLIVIWPGSILIGQIKWVEPLGEPIKVALLQGNIPQDKKWRKSFRQVSLSTYMTMSQQYRDADLIIWPETAIPMFYHRVKDSFLPTLKREAELYHSDIILGLPVMLDDGVGEYYNGLYSVRYPNQFYLKQHLVPLGEYLPLKPMSTILLNFLSIPMSDFSA
ncbi:MAG: apolipoprotein N-acyltransferase, partial [Cycloclasticus sp.]|nr:apolipoprotein N-acyltransferase [Cycloclasticus sp.]